MCCNLRCNFARGVVVTCILLRASFVVNFVVDFFRACDFYARKQNASRVFAIVWASVRLSVCLSVRLSVCHTRELYQNGAS